VDGSGARYSCIHEHRMRMTHYLIVWKSCFTSGIGDVAYPLPYAVL
jgi:hypothetical protein